MAADEEPVMDVIRRLIAEEHSLRAEQATGEGDPAVLRIRVERLEAELDQCWDLLRQRRALRVTGADGIVPAARSAHRVQSYLQ